MTRLAIGWLSGALALGACSSDGQRPGGASVDGRWGSTLSSEFVLLDLEGEGNGFSGSAEVAPGGVRDTFEVRGSARGPQLSGRLLSGHPGRDVTFSGTVRRDTLEIRLEGGGFSDRRVTLVRLE